MNEFSILEDEEDDPQLSDTEDNFVEHQHAWYLSESASRENSMLLADPSENDDSAPGTIQTAEDGYIESSFDSQSLFSWDSSLGSPRPVSFPYSSSLFVNPPVFVRFHVSAVDRDSPSREEKILQNLGHEEEKVSVPVYLDGTLCDALLDMPDTWDCLCFLDIEITTFPRGHRLIAGGASLPSLHLHLLSSLERQIHAFAAADILKDLLNFQSIPRPFISLVQKNMHKLPVETITHKRIPLPFVTDGEKVPSRYKGSHISGSGYGGRENDDLKSECPFTRELLDQQLGEGHFLCFHKHVNIFLLVQKYHGRGVDKLEDEGSISAAESETRTKVPFWALFKISSSSTLTDVILDRKMDDSKSIASSNNTTLKQMQRAENYYIDFCFYHPSGTNLSELKDSLADILVSGVQATCHRVNQLLLLHQLLNTQRASDLLLHNFGDERNSFHSDRSLQLSIGDGGSFQKRNIVPTRSSSRRSFNRTLSTYSDASLGSSLHFCSDAPHLKTAEDHGFRPGEFACPLQFSKTFSLYDRLQSQTAIMVLKDLPVLFVVTNHRNLFVYRDRKKRIFYLSLFDPSEQMEPPPQAADLHEFATIDEITNVSQPLASPESCLKLEVYGLWEVEDDISVSLVGLLESTLHEEAVSILSGLLRKNPHFQLSPADVELVRNSGNAHVATAFFPTCIRNPSMFLKYLHQNICQSEVMNHLYFQTSNEERVVRVRRYAFHETMKHHPAVCGYSKALFPLPADEEHVQNAEKLVEAECYDAAVRSPVFFGVLPDSEKWQSASKKSHPAVYGYSKQLFFSSATAEKLEAPPGVDRFNAAERSPVFFGVELPDLEKVHCEPQARFLEENKCTYTTSVFNFYYNSESTLQPSKLASSFSYAGKQLQKQIGKGLAFVGTSLLSDESEVITQITLSPILTKEDVLNLYEDIDSLSSTEFVVVDSIGMADALNCPFPQNAEEGNEREVTAPGERVQGITFRAFCTRNIRKDILYKMISLCLNQCLFDYLAERILLFAERYPSVWLAQQPDEQQLTQTSLVGERQMMAVKSGGSPKENGGKGVLNADQVLCLMQKILERSLDFSNPSVERFDSSEPIPSWCMEDLVLNLKGMMLKENQNVFEEYMLQIHRMTESGSFQSFSQQQATNEKSVFIISIGVPFNDLKKEEATSQLHQKRKFNDSTGQYNGSNLLSSVHHKSDSMALANDSLQFYDHLSPDVLQKNVDYDDEYNRRIFAILSIGVSQQSMLLYNFHPNLISKMHALLCECLTWARYQRRFLENILHQKLGLGFHHSSLCSSIFSLETFHQNNKPMSLEPRRMKLTFDELDHWAKGEDTSAVGAVACVPVRTATPPLRNWQERTPSRSTTKGPDRGGPDMALQAQLAARLRARGMRRMPSTHVTHTPGMAKPQRNSPGGPPANAKRSSTPPELHSPQIVKQTSSIGGLGDPNSLPVFFPRDINLSRDGSMFRDSIGSVREISGKALEISPKKVLQGPEGKRGSVSTKPSTGSSPESKAESTELIGKLLKRVGVVPFQASSRMWQQTSMTNCNGVEGTPLAANCQFLRGLVAGAAQREALRNKKVEMVWKWTWAYAYHQQLNRLEFRTSSKRSLSSEGSYGNISEEQNMNMQRRGSIISSCSEGSIDVTITRSRYGSEPIQVPQKLAQNKPRKKGYMVPFEDKFKNTIFLQGRGLTTKSKSTSDDPSEQRKNQPDKNKEYGGSWNKGINQRSTEEVKRSSSYRDESLAWEDVKEVLASCRTQARRTAPLITLERWPHGFPPQATFKDLAGAYQIAINQMAEEFLQYYVWYLTTEVGFEVVKMHGQLSHIKPSSSSPQGWNPKNLGSKLLRKSVPVANVVAFLEVCIFYQAEPGSTLLATCQLSTLDVKPPGPTSKVPLQSSLRRQALRTHGREVSQLLPSIQNFRWLVPLGKFDPSRFHVQQLPADLGRLLESLNLEGKIFNFVVQKLRQHLYRLVHKQIRRNQYENLIGQLSLHIENLKNSFAGSCQSGIKNSMLLEMIDVPFEQFIPNPILQSLCPTSRRLYDSILETPAKYSPYIKQLSCRSMGIVSRNMPKNFIYGGICFSGCGSGDFIVLPHDESAHCTFALLLPQSVSWFKCEDWTKMSKQEQERKMIVLLFGISQPMSLSLPWTLDFYAEKAFTVINAFIVQAIQIFTRDAKWEKLLRGMDLSAMDLPCPFNANDLMYLMRTSCQTPLSDLEKELGCSLPPTDCNVPWRVLFEDIQEKYPHPSLIFYDTQSQCHILFRCPLVNKSTPMSSSPFEHNNVSTTTDEKCLNGIAIYVCLGPPSTNAVSISVLQREESIQITEYAYLSAITDFTNMILLWCWDHLLLTS